jgi:hypothetical protein
MRLRKFGLQRKRVKKRKRRRLIQQIQPELRRLFRNGKASL